ncbi:MAG: hypothetical protein N3G80_04295 [Candidatus Micrarchaeota archaeon]|nr:hypothetical protein [Candidatus Micrarchaeota archaeon]
MMCKKYFGQASFEALLSFALLLSCITLLFFHANGICGKFVYQIEASAEKIRLSNAALLLDSAASSKVFAQFQENLTNISVQGDSVFSPKYPQIRQKLLHNASVGQDGTIYVQAQ